VIHLNKGKPFPLGSSLTSQGVNFSLIATNAEYVEILLFEKEDSIYPKSIFKLDQTHNKGPYWHAEIKNLDEGCIYAFRVKQKNSSINNNYEKKVLLDPCSRGITGWGSYKRENALKTQENTNSCLKSVVCDRNYLILRIIQDQNILGKKQLFMNSISNPSLNQLIKIKVASRIF